MYRTAERCTTILAFVWLIGFNCNVEADEQLVFCDRLHANHIVYHTTERGNIVSPGYPDNIPVKENSSEPCIMTITACESCRIRLVFDEMWANSMPSCHASAPTSGSCIAGCDHLYIYEPGNEELTYKYVTSSNIPSNYTFTTQTRVLSIRYCQSKETNMHNKKFLFSYEVLGKEPVTFHGLPSDSGQFTSLDFPRSYSSNGDVFVYHIHNDDADGRIRLSFDDWNLSPYSSVVIFPDGNRSNTAKAERKRGSQTRPFVISDGADMAVEFWTSNNVGEFIGFKATFQFVSAADWPEKPTIVDEVYYNHNFGGRLLFNFFLRCRLNDPVYIDLLWVIPRSNVLNASTDLMLRLEEEKLSAGDTLEIRSGNNSEGQLVSWSESESELYDPAGFYVRLRTRCNAKDKFSVVFAWLQAQEDSKCLKENDVLCADMKYCLSSSLQCDGISHCADATDEEDCDSVLQPTEPPMSEMCVTRNYFYCVSDKRKICSDQRCNGIFDCDDYSDEHGCGGHGHNNYDDYDPFRTYGTLGVVVPVTLSCIILFIIMCSIIGYMVQRRRRRLAIRMARQLMQHRAAMRAAVGDTEQHMMTTQIMTPPSYEDAVVFNNMGFIMPAAVDGSPSHPPPYACSDKPDDDAPDATTCIITSHRFRPPSYVDDRDAGSLEIVENRNATIDMSGANTTPSCSGS